MCEVNQRIMNEKEQLFHDIGVIDFVIVEMQLYLNTHPTDKEAMDYLSHYVRMKNQAMREYAMKFGPLSISDADGCQQNEWKWGMQPWPWEGGC